MLSRIGVASRACPRHSASINPGLAPCRAHKKYAANEGDAGEQKVEPFNKVSSVAARDLLLAQAPNNADSVLVRMVRIKHMGVPVRHRLMPVRMAVRSGRNLLVTVVVVPIIVGVWVLMFGRHVMMLVPMRLDEVQRHAGQQQGTPCSHAPTQ